MDDLTRDEQDLARFGYKQELKRSLGVFSSFAVAFSYISLSTGIFALFALGLTTVGGVFIWSWPIVAIGIAITIMNIFGVRLVAIVNNTGVLFEILGMVVFAFVLALFHHHQSAGIIFDTGGTNLTVECCSGSRTSTRRSRRAGGRRRSSTRTSATPSRRSSCSSWRPRSSSATWRS
jgi:hypothetical protein